MDIVAQIITEKVGETKRKEFQVARLENALSSSGDRKHVTLYPADYKTEYQGQEIDIPSEVTVTIMPGAVVGYKEDYQYEGFQVDDGEGGTKTYDGPPLAPTDPNESSNHPLNYRSGDDPDSYAERYEAPEFTGAVENITDLNLASEWATRQEFERAVWSVKGKEAGTEGGRTRVSFTVPYKGTVEYDGGNKIYVQNEEVAGEDDGAKLTFSHTKYDDESFPDKDENPFKNNETAKVIQSITVDDGHVLNAEVSRVVQRLGPKDEGDFLNFTGNYGNFEIGHSATGPTDEDGNPVEVTQPPTGETVSIKAFATDNRGHVQNVEYGPNVEKVKEGNLVTISNSDGDRISGDAIPTIGINTNKINGSKNVDITPSTTGDGEGTLEFSLSDPVYREARDSDPADPDSGEYVLWLSDGTETGDDGDVLLKITDSNGTTKRTKIADFNNL